MHVDPDIAVTAMTRLWHDNGNAISTPLLSTWRTMCDALNQAGRTGSSVGWAALAMPTGIGKTQFAALYCALMQNPTITPHDIRSISLHPGVLFVTRLVSEADKFVEKVNELAGCKIAAAYYYGSLTTLDQATRFPVLAITHSACERHQLRNSLDTSGESIWDRLTSWHHSRRAKIIIDETPNFATSVQINSNWLALTLGALKYLPDACPKMYFELELLLTSITDPLHTDKKRQISTGEFNNLELIDIARMREHLINANDYALTIDYDSKKISLRKICQSTLSAIEAIQANGWGWISFRDQIAQLNSATLHPSLRNGSGIILDATAALYPGYGLLSPPAEVIYAPANVRNYDNVTLHVARGHKVGKGYMTENAEKLWPLYRAAIEAELPNNERMLVCCHKEFRNKVDITPLPRISFAHYGEINGRNDWDAYEAVALLGLEYLDAATPVNIAQALLGVQTNEWLQTQSARCTDEHDDVPTALQRGHMSVSAVQAISRVRCRRAIDSAGRCNPTLVFITLPNGEDGDAVLSAIVSNMPGLRIKTWHVDAARRKQRTIPATEALVDFFTATPAAVYTKSDVRTAAGISPASLDRTIKRMSCATSAERERLDNLGVTYYPQRGQGAESYFVKA